MTPPHTHRWLLGDGEAAEGVCRECGQRRRFTGGLPPNLFGQASLPPMAWDDDRIESLDELAEREFARWGG